MSESEECVECGGTVAPDGHCWDCGAAQPGFRAHVEITAEGGAAGVSDRGRRRGVNADAMALATTGPWTVGVVCDGVSMSPRAERAARVAADVGLDCLARQLSSGAIPEVALVGAAVRAHRAVAALAKSAATTAQSAGAAAKSAGATAERPDVTAAVAPACTYVAGVAGPDGIWSASVGDSRAYWLPDEGPGAALTEDDTGDLDALTAWLGADADEPVPQVRSYLPPCSGRLLLCTDGLWRYLPDAEGLRAVVRRARAGGGGPTAEARALVGYALEAGGQDNVTALLLPVASSVPPG
ncbi:protein phosphatase 2C domain-containing protein [Streptomyces sp. NPDC046862]|uniref:PP2C family protein-serine/threonine phosphatase n=1 Tax=Streptomyces sp. NPDC046862 TaxID=3154603 RepID=UPI00345466C0